MGRMGDYRGGRHMDWKQQVGLAPTQPGNQSLAQRRHDRDAQARAAAYDANRESATAPKPFDRCGRARDIGGAHPDTRQPPVEEGTAAMAPESGSRESDRCPGSNRPAP
jgi:hypothetical protein